MDQYHSQRRSFHVPHGNLSALSILNEPNLQDNRNVFHAQRLERKEQDSFRKFNEKSNSTHGTRKQRSR